MDARKLLAQKRRERKAPVAAARGPATAKANSLNGKANSVKEAVQEEEGPELPPVTDAPSDTTATTTHDTTITTETSNVSTPNTSLPNAQKPPPSIEDAQFKAQLDEFASFLAAADNDDDKQKQEDAAKEPENIEVEPEDDEDEVDAAALREELEVEQTSLSSRVSLLRNKFKTLKKVDSAPALLKRKRVAAKSGGDSDEDDESDEGDSWRRRKVK